MAAQCIVSHVKSRHHHCNLLQFYWEKHNYAEDLDTYSELVFIHVNICFRSYCFVCAEHIRVRSLTNTVILETIHKKLF